MAIIQQALLTGKQFESAEASKRDLARLKSMRQVQLEQSRVYEYLQDMFHTKTCEKQDALVEIKQTKELLVDDQVYQTIQTGTDLHCYD